MRAVRGGRRDPVEHHEADDAASGTRLRSVATTTAVMNSAENAWPTITAGSEPVRRPATAPKKSASPQPTAAINP